MAPHVLTILTPSPLDMDDVSVSSSSTPTLSFEHVATSEVVEELNRFEVTTRQELQQVLEESNAIPSFSWNDVSIDSVLGEGAFSFVFQVQIDKQIHALKCLKAKAIMSTDDLMFNAMDLQTEAQILSRVNHPHIIQLTGLSQCALGDSFRKADGYFLLLEIMEMTLLDKLTQWRNEMESKAQRKQLLSRNSIERRLLHIAMPVASAMNYLHSHQIVLRDLKPENIGFDSHGQVKLFDFGLARMVQTVDSQDIAGSVCYMAPETLLGQGTQLASDIYSLTIVFWELCTLELPMARFQTMEQVQQRVAKGKWRPSVSSIPSRELRNHFRKGWAPKSDDRPTAAEVLQVLHRVCGMEDEDSLMSDSARTHASAQSMPQQTNRDEKEPPKRSKSFQNTTSFRSLFEKR